jgi:hypothetical protein
MIRVRVSVDVCFDDVQGEGQDSRAERLHQVTESISDGLKSGGNFVRLRVDGSADYVGTAK